MKKVAIIMGSDSDLPTAEKAATELKKLEIPFEVHVMSAHRTPDEASAFSKNAEENGFGVIISIAGMAAHLGGVLAANTVLPVIGVPVGSSFGGLDALLATVQMPSGIPVATVALGGGKKRRNSRGSNACSLRRLSSGEAARYEKRNGRSGS